MAPRPTLEYLLTKACGSSNTGSRSAPAMTGVLDADFLSGGGRSSFYENPLKVGWDLSTNAIATDPGGAMDIFGSGVGNPQFTVAAWFYVRPGDSTTAAIGFTFWPSTYGTNGWDWGGHSLKFRLWYAPVITTYQGAYYDVVGNDKHLGFDYENKFPLTSVWVHMAFTTDGSVWKLFKNGIVVKQGSWPAAIPSNTTVYETLNVFTN